MHTATIKSIAALALTGAGSALVVGFQTTDDLAVPITAGAGSDSARVSTPQSTAAPGSGSTSGSTSGSGATAAPSATGGSATGTAAYADGTWTGAPISEPWGPFRVAVVITNGTISKVSVVESPTDRHSSRINNQAVPMLTQSTLATQATKVDMVSGATWTSESYAESLQSALDAAAKAA